MTTTAEQLAALANLPHKIGADLGSKFGGIVRCETCGDQWDVTSERAARYTASGWPTCCGHSMHWWTQRQIDAGEMPTLGAQV